MSVAVAQPFVHHFLDDVAAYGYTNIRQARQLQRFRRRPEAHESHNVFPCRHTVNGLRKGGICAFVQFRRCCHLLPNDLFRRCHILRFLRGSFSPGVRVHLAARFGVARFDFACQPLVILVSKFGRMAATGEIFLLLDDVLDFVQEGGKGFIQT